MVIGEFGDVKLAPGSLRPHNERSSFPHSAPSRFW